MKVCGPEAGLPVKLKRTEENNLLALKLVMSGVSSVIPCRYASKLFIPMLALNETEKRKKKLQMSKPFFLYVAQFNLALEPQQCKYKGHQG